MSQWQVALICCLIIVVAKLGDCSSRGDCTEENIRRYCIPNCDDTSDPRECARIYKECGCKQAIYLLIGISLVCTIIPTICCCGGICYFLNKSKKKKRGEVLKLPHNNKDTTVRTISQPHFVTPAPPPPPYSKSNNGIIPDNCMPMPGLAPAATSPTAPVMI